MLFFQLINARHERASTVLTSNKGFEEWGHVLGDEIMAAALIDRLLHHCHIVNIRGSSYRMREHQHWLRAASEQRRESQRDRRLRSFAARFGQDSGRSAPCVQPKTPDGHQRENVRSARDISPRSVQFSVAIDTRPRSRLGDRSRKEPSWPVRDASITRRHLRHRLSVERPRVSGEYAIDGAPRGRTPAGEPGR